MSGSCQLSLGGGLPPTDRHRRVTLVFSSTSIVSSLASLSMLTCSITNDSGTVLTTKLLTLETRASRAWKVLRLFLDILSSDIRVIYLDMIFCCKVVIFTLNLLGVTLHCQLPSSNSSSASLMRREQSPLRLSPFHSYLPGNMPIGTPSFSHLRKIVFFEDRRKYFGQICYYRRNAGFKPGYILPALSLLIGDDTSEENSLARIDLCILRLLDPGLSGLCSNDQDHRDGQ